jgi:hypothetical protein
MQKNQLAFSLGYFTFSGMSGINYVVDEKGRKAAVVIDLKKHAGIWEDFYDTALARSFKSEPRASLESVKRKRHRKDVYRDI